MWSVLLPEILEQDLLSKGGDWLGVGSKECDSYGRHLPTTVPTRVPIQPLFTSSKTITKTPEQYVKSEVNNLKSEDTEMAAVSSLLN